MPAITWTATFVDGVALTAAQLEQMKTDITTVVNGTIDSSNISAGSIQISDLANPQSYYTIEVTCHSDADALGSGALATAQPGLADSLTSADFPFRVGINSTLIGITTCCGTSNTAGSAADNTATVRQNGANLSATTTIFVTDTATHTGSLSIALLTTDTLVIRCATDTAATDGVARARVILHLQANHRVTA